MCDDGWRVFDAALLPRVCCCSMLRPETVERDASTDRSVFEAQSAVLDGSATRMYLKIARFLDRAIDRALTRSETRRLEVNVFIGSEGTGLRT